MLHFKVKWCVISLFFCRTLSVRIHPHKRETIMNFIKIFLYMQTRYCRSFTYPMAWGNSSIKDFDEWKKSGT